MKKLYRDKHKSAKAAKQNQKAKKATRKTRCLKPIKSKKVLNELVKKIRHSHKNSTLALLRIYMTKNWAELGYTSFKDFIEQRLPQENYETVLSRVTSAEVMFSLGGEKAVGIYSLNASRAIKTVQGDDRKKLWLALVEKAKESSTGKLTPSWLTASRVEEVISSLFGNEDDENNHDCSTNDPAPEDKHYNSDEQGISDIEGMNHYPPLKTVKKSSERETTQPKKDKPHSEIEINKAKSNVISRVSKSEALQAMLEEYDGSVSLARMIALYSVDNFDVETLARMKRVFVKGINHKKQSDPNMLEVQS
jgi:hypothetical protein